LLGEWHQITNPFNETCHIIEIQFGDEVTENDIERLDYFSPQ
jgi:mannose-6-phosphate isomerase-like protein (cupin superfamily)